MAAAPTRHERCDACWRNCRYTDFRGSVPTKPGATGEGPWGAFADEGSAQQRKLTEDIAAGKVSGVTRKTILGALRSRKHAQWVEQIRACYYRGQTRPRTTDEALSLATRLGGTGFRVQCLGMSHDEARAIRRSVTIDEFLRWWRVVGHQQELDLYVGEEDMSAFLEQLG